MNAMKSLSWGVVVGLGAMVSCQSQKDPAPAIKASLTETWWCNSQNLLPDQYFGAEGLFKQRLKGEIQSGQWSISEDNKSILISNFGASGEGTWSYGLKDLQDNQLVFTFYGAENSFSKCQ